MNPAQLRALRAASRVTFTLGIFGCAEDAPTAPAPDPVEAAEEADAQVDAAPIDEADAQHELFVDAATDPSLDAGAPVPADAGPEADGALVDAAGGDAGPHCDLNAPDYTACCDAVGWDFRGRLHGVGSPVPPALLA
ncbi:MAG: hypothetical protein R3F43_31260 [bacterium]